MNQTAIHPTPGIIGMIREDHAQVMGAFHEYDANASPERKQQWAESLGQTLKLQARLKEEILYPALRAAQADEASLSTGEAAHHQMHSLVGQLRDMRPTATRYDDTVLTLQDVFSRQMVEEETVLLPQAERLLQDQLDKLGVKMRTRRLVLNGPGLHKVGMALAAAAGLAVGLYAARRALNRRV